MPEYLTIEENPECKLTNHIGDLLLQAAAIAEKPTFHWYRDLYK